MEDEQDEIGDVPMEDTLAFNEGKLESEKDLDAKFPDRPRNTKPTLYFRTLCQDLLEPLQKLSVRGSAAHRPATKQRLMVKRRGPFQLRVETIERFIQHWRNDVGKDLYPAFRLILPDKDNDRQVYGLKEQALGVLLVKILGIASDSDDAKKLKNWKVPLSGFGADGDFPAKCYNALKARSMLTDPGDMTIGEVNDLLNELSISKGAEQRLPILKEFYHKMNAEEMTWLIRIILKQTRIGTGHEVFLRLMHEGALSKWSSTSSLRTVCWTFYDDTCVWDGDVSIKLFNCFQPQLCKQFSHDFDKIVEKMEGTAEDPEFWVQEKIDGERIQMHMDTDSKTGARTFRWYSRKSTDYTAMYGSSFSDESGALTKYLDKAFPYNLKNIILDGEMIGWDPLTKTLVPFGTLKSIAKDEGENQKRTTSYRVLFKVFDCLYANHKDVTKYTLRDRRKLLEQAVQPVEGRLEFLDYWTCTKPEQIEEKLRQVIAESSEGLVLKNPRSAYTLTIGTRADSWVKIKPDYMNELGEKLDCLIIGAYYGSGSRGGRHSSFLIGLRIATDPENPERGTNPQKCWSFVKVGGGYTADDYKSIREKTEGKWHKWNRNNPPNEYIELAGGHLQYERPDEWIKPEDSVVVAIKATQVVPSDRVRTEVTLRFPRFTSLKTDKDWQNALSMAEFIELQSTVEQERSQKRLEVDRERQLKRRKTTASRKKPLSVVGADGITKIDHGQQSTGCFAGMEFCVMTDLENPPPGEPRMTKRQLEELISSNGGIYWASPEKRSPDLICVADKKPTNVYALMKKGTHHIVRPAWVIDCVNQTQLDKEHGNGLGQYLPPLEAGRHVFFAKDRGLEDEIEGNLDEFGDSYARDLNAEELRDLLSKVPKSTKKRTEALSTKLLLEALDSEEEDLPNLTSLLFAEQDICFYEGLAVAQDTNGTEDNMDIDDDPQARTSPEIAQDMDTYMSLQYARFGGASVSSTLKPESTTHVVICPPNHNNEEPHGGILKQIARALREEISSSWKPGISIPRIVTREWIETCWNERTLVDEDRFAVY